MIPYTDNKMYLHCAYYVKYNTMFGSSWLRREINIYWFLVAGACFFSIVETRTLLKQDSKENSVFLYLKLRF